jgi:hypothetical protein
MMAQDPAAQDPAAQASEAADDQLIRRLRRIAAQADPVPPALISAAKAAFALRDVDAAVAELVRDSAVDSPAMAVRGHDVRMLSFQAGGTAIECEVTASGGGRDVSGQLSGEAWVSGPASVVAQVAGGQPVSAEVRAHGFFSVRGLPPGPFRLRCQLADGSTVVTSWTTM